MKKKLLLLPVLLTACLAPITRGQDTPVPRQYAPDRTFQVHHLALDVTPDFRQRSVSGTATITFQPIATPLEEMKLDAVNLRIQSVESPEKIESYYSTADHLIITFAQPIPAEKETRVTITYSAEPKIGMYFRTPELGFKAEEEHLFTQGEEIDARHWYPCFDAPNEKFTTEMTCHVPQGMIALSNGKLVSEDKDAAGLSVFHWTQELPMANYLVTLVAGHFKKWEDHHGDIPLPVYTPPLDEGDVPLSFGDTRDVMEFFNGEIGVPYPWVKYGQVVVRDFVEGGMENVSLTTLTDRSLFTAATENIVNSDSLISHEMAHQWFGDLVTCKDWSQIWLNEGFATFYAELYNQHKNGDDADLYAAYGTVRAITARSTDTRPIVNPKFNDPQERFDFLSYDKGGFVLRMLRAQLGVPLYRQCIKTYLERHKFGNVVTEDLSSVVEELSGRSFDRFFDQWVYHGHYPEIDAHYAWDEKTKMAKITVTQTQKTGDDVLMFDFPFTVAFQGKDGEIERTMQVTNREAEFYFPLSEAPRSVVVDPHLALLGQIHFGDFSEGMAGAALENDSDVVGRLRAVEKLGSGKNHFSIDKLKHALQHDKFYGVRQEAASALRTIHTEDSLLALLDSQAQSDARVRLRVMDSIGGFYDPRAFAAEKKALADEKNPDVAAAEIRALGNSGSADVRDVLVSFLKSNSYRHTLLNAAISAMSASHDEYYLPYLIDTVKARANELSSREFSTALSAIATLARDQENRDAPRELIAGFVNSNRQTVQTASIRALGELEDPRAIPILNSFTATAASDPNHDAAVKALEQIRSRRRATDAFKELRDTVNDLQSENRKLRADVESLQKQFEAQQKADKKRKK
jgi:aminopeptidase N